MLASLVIVRRAFTDPLFVHSNSISMLSIFYTLDYSESLQHPVVEAQGKRFEVTPCDANVPHVVCEEPTCERALERRRLLSVPF